MKLNRLIYKSTAKQKSLEDKVLSDLVSQCSSNNKSRGINGLLLLSDNRFLQVLEGPSKFLNELYQSIIKDDRHSEVQLMQYESISEPSFSDWNMRLIDLSKVSPAVHNMLLTKYPHNNETIVFPENKILLHSLLLDALYFSNFSSIKDQE